MRARLGIDTSKSWADQAEEEEEEATLIVTPEDAKADAEPKCEPSVQLGMRLRGGEGGVEGEEESSEPDESDTTRPASTTAPPPSPERRAAQRRQRDPKAS